MYSTYMCPILTCVYVHGFGKRDGLVDVQPRCLGGSCVLRSIRYPRMRCLPCASWLHSQPMWLRTRCSIYCTPYVLLSGHGQLCGRGCHQGCRILKSTGYGCAFLGGRPVCMFLMFACLQGDVMYTWPLVPTVTCHVYTYVSQTPSGALFECAATQRNASVTNTSCGFPYVYRGFNRTDCVWVNGVEACKVWVALSP